MKKDRRKELAGQIAREQGVIKGQTVMTLIRQYLAGITDITNNVKAGDKPVERTIEAITTGLAELEAFRGRQQVAIGKILELDEAHDVFLERIATRIMEMDPRYMKLNSKLMSALILDMDTRTLEEVFGPDGKLTPRVRRSILRQFADIIEEIHS